MSGKSRRVAVGSLCASLVTGMLLAAAPVHAKAVKSVSTLRVMLNPAAAPGGAFPDEARRRLEALAGVPLSVAGVTRTGTGI